MAASAPVYIGAGRARASLNLPKGQLLTLIIKSGSSRAGLNFGIFCELTKVPVSLNVSLHVLHLCLTESLVAPDLAVPGWQTHLDLCEMVLALTALTNSFFAFSSNSRSRWMWMRRIVILAISGAPG